MQLTPATRKINRTMLVGRRILGGVAALAMATALPFADAKTFRWASQGDILTMDPHSQNEGLNNSASDHIYEPLINRGKTMAIEPCLAISWTQINPTTMRFKLRDKVIFHNDAIFTADDVVFSITRALEKTSDFSAYMQGIKSAKKIDSLTVDIVSDGPNPTLLDQLTEVRMMNKAWALKNNAQKPQDFKNNEETYTARNTNGTGPFILKAREPDVKTAFVVNPKWWGKRDSESIDEVIYTPIKNNATRISALLSGEIDFVLDPPVQDVPKLKENKAIKIMEGNENRTLFLNFDQGRDELLYGSKGKNPFKDIRVRQAMLQAIDINAIYVSVMRKLSLPTMSLIAPQVRGYTKDVENRPPVDIVKAKKLMADAGFGNGFDVTLDCTDNRYINDQAICVAIAGMLAKIDIRVKVNAMPRALYFPKLQNTDTSMYLLGWGVPTFDSLYTLQSIVRTKGQGGDGTWNFSGYSNPKIDTIIDALKTEVDLKKRAQLTKAALLLEQTDVAPHSAASSSNSVGHAQQHHGRAPR